MDYFCSETPILETIVPHYYILLFFTHISMDYVWIIFTVKLQLSRPLFYVIISICSYVHNIFHYSLLIALYILFFIVKHQLSKLMCLVWFQIYLYPENWADYKKKGYVVKSKFFENCFCQHSFSEIGEISTQKKKKSKNFF